MISFLLYLLVVLGVQGGNAAEHCEPLTWAAKPVEWPKIPTMLPESISFVICYPTLHDLESKALSRSVPIRIEVRSSGRDSDKSPPSPALTVRILGPSLAACNYIRTFYGRSVVELYYSCPVSVQGVYFISTLVNFANANEAYHGFPECTGTCVCRELFLATEPKRPSLEVISTSGGATSAGYTGWILKPSLAATGQHTTILESASMASQDMERLWIYTQRGRAPLSIPDAKQCLKDTTVFMVGDSHQGRTSTRYQRLGLDEARMRSIFTTGLDEHPTFPRQIEAGCDKRTQRVYKNATTHGGMIAEAIKLREVAQQSGPGNKLVFVFESGHWDTRDETMELTHPLLIYALETIAELASRYVRVVWRTAPAYSYKRSSPNEYQTNEKLEKMAAEAWKHVNWQRLPVHIHDTFAITLPLLERSCDSHHYICNNQKGRQDSVPGIADDEALLTLLCEVAKD